MGYTLGFIGVGHMGSVLAEAALRSVAPCEVAVSNRTAARAAVLSERLGCAAESVERTALESRFVVIGVKPQNITELFHVLGPILRERRDRFILVSMAAGVTISRLIEELGYEVPVIRIMPNTPVAVGAGCVLYSVSRLVQKEETEELLKLFAGAGKLVSVDEGLMDAGSTLSGSGPAFVCKFIMALAGAAERLGLSPETALELSKRTVYGTASLVLASSETPGELCDAVCSPGGSTIQGVRALDSSSFSNALDAALEATFKRNQELGRI